MVPSESLYRQQSILSVFEAPSAIAEHTFQIHVDSSSMAVVGSQVPGPDQLNDLWRFLEDEAGDATAQAGYIQPSK